MASEGFAVNLEGLRYVQAVAQTASFSAAARAYGVTQPALSKGVSRVEEELGLKLFDRSPRGATPTAYGLRMLPMIDGLLGALDSLMAEAGRLAGPVPRFRIGVSPLIGSGLVAAAVATVGRLGSPLDPVFREADLEVLHEALVRGELDLLLVPAVLPMPSFRHRVIAREQVAVVDPTGRPGTGPLELEAAVGLDYIMVPDTCGLTTFTAQLFRRAGLPLRTYPGEAASFRVLDDWARLGLGAALLPMSKVARQGEDCRPLVRQGVPVEIEYEAVWAPENPIVSDFEHFVESLRLTAAWQGESDGLA